MATLKPQDYTTVQEKSEQTSQTSSSPPPEKVLETENAHLDLERIGEEQGYVLDEALLKQRLGLAADAQLKKAPDGTVLIPQPTDDPRDPLNWSPWKKRSIMIMLGMVAFTSDYSAATGASALIAQATQWRISPNTVNHATAGNTFMLGVGGIFVVWLSAFFGRLPVIFTFTILSAATAIWSASAQSFESYMASRILNGFFAVAGAGGGLMWINDVFFYHERPRMINLWSTAIILSPFLGPCFMAAILQKHSWRDGMYLNFAFIAAALLAIVLLGDETFYPRHKAKENIPDIYNRPRALRLTGVPQVSTRYTDNTLVGAASRTALVLSRAVVVLTCVYYFFDFGFTVANNTTISVLLVPAYKLTYYNLAALYVAPIIGAILGMVIGHFIFDLIGKIWARRNNGVIEPEARLIPIWLVLPFKIIGYNLVGVTMQKHWSYYVLAVGWGMHNFATIVTTAAVSAYLIDAYPEASGESAAWLNFSRTLAGFILGYIQLNWAQAEGTEQEYGIQTAIMGGAFLFFIVPLTFMGKKLRHKQGALKFKTN